VKLIVCDVRHDGAIGARRWNRHGGEGRRPRIAITVTAIPVLAIRPISTRRSRTPITGAVDVLFRSNSGRAKPWGRRPEACWRDVRDVELLYLLSPSVLGRCDPEDGAALPASWTFATRCSAHGRRSQAAPPSYPSSQVARTRHGSRRCLTPTPARAVWHLCWGAGAPQRHNDPQTHIATNDNSGTLHALSAEGSTCGKLSQPIRSGRMLHRGRLRGRIGRYGQPPALGEGTLHELGRVEREPAAGSGRRRSAPRAQRRVVRHLVGQERAVEPSGISIRGVGRREAPLDDLG